MPLYMLIKGVQGNVTTKGFEGAIQIHSLANLSNRPVEQQVGMANREIGTLHLDHMQLHKSLDAASGQLAQYYLMGKHIPQVTIMQVQLANGQAEWQMKMVLSNVLIASLDEQASLDGADELMTFAYSKIEKSYRSQCAAGRWQAPKHTSFDLLTASAG